MYAAACCGVVSTFPFKVRRVVQSLAVPLKGDSRRRRRKVVDVATRDVLYKNGDTICLNKV